MVGFRRWLAESSGPEKRRIFGYAFGPDIRRCGVLRPRRLRHILVACILLFQPGAGQELKQVRRVAVFYELGFFSPAVNLTDREMRAVLDNSRYQIELCPDYFETTLFRCVDYSDAFIREIL
jgi:hypothetical protein